MLSSEDPPLPLIDPTPLQDKHRCLNCGYLQNKDMLHVYRICYRCKREVVPAAVLQVSPEQSKFPLVILMAAYGHVTDPFQAFDITDRLKELVSQRSQLKDVLYISQKLDLTQIFGDPCPNRPKAIKIRYIKSGQRGEVEVRESSAGHLSRPLLIRSTNQPQMLMVYKATYGSMGSGTYDSLGTIDVTEKICGNADLNGGSYIEILHGVSTAEIFGVPCSENRKKFLTIRYEVEGNIGTIEEWEVDDHLIKPLQIKFAVPRIEPMILIISAKYGRTQDMIKQRTKEIQKEVNEIFGLQARQSTGAQLKKIELKKIATFPRLQAEIDDMIDNQIKCLDVTEIVQRRVEAANGDCISFKNGVDDANAIFGNPCPGLRKELRIKYVCLGNDVDMETESEELTTRGFQRNIIAHLNGELAVEVHDDSLGGGVFKKDIRVNSAKSFPVLDITSAKFGIPGDNVRTKNVKNSLQKLILDQGGWFLDIATSQSLREIFGKSYNTRMKKLSIAYMLRGLVGTFRVDEIFGRFRCDIRLGYPTTIDWEELDGVIPKQPPKDLESMESFSIKENLKLMRKAELQGALSAPVMHKKNLDGYCKAKIKDSMKPIEIRNSRNLTKSGDRVTQTRSMGGARRDFLKSVKSLCPPIDFNDEQEAAVELKYLF